MMWYGGYSYRLPEAGDAEWMESLAAAVRLFEDRIHNTAYPHTPCVDEEIAWAKLYLEDPRTFHEFRWPDYIIFVGPRGGIRLQQGGLDG